MTGLSFIHPWLLAGLVAAVLPVLIHLIGRKRAPTVPFAAFDFLVAVNRRLARREKLRQFLLLTLRTLAVVALVLALARPTPQRALAVGPSSTSVVFMLDASGSMAYRHEGVSLFEKAQAQAAHAIEQLNPADNAAVILAGRSLEVPAANLSLDHNFLRRAVLEAPPPDGSADMGAAFERALAMLEGRPGPRLVVFSDMAKHSFGRLSATSTGAQPALRLVDVARDARNQEGSPLFNLGLTHMEQDHAGGSPNQRQVTVRVHNYSDQEAIDHPIELTIDGRSAVNGYVSVPPRTSVDKSFSVTFPHAAMYHLEASLGPNPNPDHTAQDGYAPDNEARLAIRVVPGTRVVAVNGDPRSVPYEDELFFLERALAARPVGAPALSVRMISLEELAFEPPDRTTADVMVFANVGSLPEEALDHLERFVAQGGGVLVAMGNKVAFETFNAQFGPLLPTKLRDRHRAADADAQTPALGIGWMDWEHPILRGLGGAAEESLRSSRTNIYFNLQAGSAKGARSLLRFDNGAPALVEYRKESRSGSILLVTTSLDLDDTDLPLRSVYPPLMQRAVRYLGQGIASDVAPQARAGETIRVPMPAKAEALRYTQDRQTDQALTFALSGPSLSLTAPKKPGFYRAELQQGGTWQAAPQLDLAVSAPLAESDFAPTTAQAVAAALEDPSAPHGDSLTVTMGGNNGEEPFEGRKAASSLLLALCLLFVAESLLAARG